MGPHKIFCSRALQSLNPAQCARREGFWRPGAYVIWRLPLSPPLSFPSLHLEEGPLEVDLLNPANGSGERCKLPQWSLGRSLSRQRFWCILRTYRNATDVHFSMHMICPPMLISASNELTEFLYISCRKKITSSPFGAQRSADAQGLCSCPYPPLLIRPLLLHKVCIIRSKLCSVNNAHVQH